MSKLARKIQKRPASNPKQIHRRRLFRRRLEEQEEKKREEGRLQEAVQVGRAASRDVLMKAHTYAKRGRKRQRKRVRETQR